MKFRIHGIFLSLFFALAVCFSFSTEASAHDYERSDGQHTYTHPNVEGISAADVDVGDEASVKKFLLHMATHLDLIDRDDTLDELIKQERSREIVIFGKRTREEGAFNSADKNIYPIGTTSRGYITNHGKYSDLYGKRVISSYEFKDANDMTTGTLGDLLGAGNLSEDADPTCVEYDDAGQERVACAIKQKTPLAVITTITGLHHEEDDSNIIDVNDPDCNSPDFKLKVTAKQVNDETDPQEKEKLLVSYIDAMIEKALGVINSTLVETFNDPENAQLLEIVKTNATLAATDMAAQAQIANALTELTEKSSARAYEIISCFSEGDFKDGSIYAFIMDPVRGVSFLNGLDFDLHGLSVSLTDPDPIPDADGNVEANVLKAFQKVVTTDGSGDVEKEGNLAEGNSGFVTYHWDDPDDPDDRIENNLATGCVPGRSVKKSYIRLVNSTPSELPGLLTALDPTNPVLGFIAQGVDANPIYFVFGSGVYPDAPNTEKVCESTTETGGDNGDGGCAISTTGNTLQSTLLNLFLIASVLFSAVFLRKRV